MVHALAAALAAAAVAGGTSVMSLHADFQVRWGEVSCPKGTPLSTSCYLNVGRGIVRGLGAATERYTLRVVYRGGSCVDWRYVAELTVVDKGTLRVAARNHGCFSPTQTDGTVYFTVTGGTGRFAGSTGSGTIDATNSVETGPGHGTNTDTWSGRLTLPG